ncbi:MAG: peptidoglycan editing factor PgeF [Pseudomonadota bacterium]
MADFDIERSEVLGDVPHGFFGSGGGVHQFGYGGPGDPAHIADLRAKAAEAIVPGSQIVMPHQVHSPDVITVTEPWPDTQEGRPVADALVTANTGLAIGIVTADCAPVLFADEESGVVGAAHAGWRGAHGGVLAQTVSAMEKLGAQNNRIAAAIGPTIAQPSYEVDAPFRENFTEADDVYFKPAPQREGTPRWHFDLPGYIAKILAELGLEKIHDTARDTFPHPVRYHSYRRASFAAEPGYGRQISLIALG